MHIEHRIVQMLEIIGHNQQVVYHYLRVIDAKLTGRGLNVGDKKALAGLRDKLAQSEQALTDAVASAVGVSPTYAAKEFNVANPILQQLTDQVKANTDAEASAVLALNGIAARIDAAVKKALENGATAEELAPVAAEVAGLKASATALAEAVVANTPAA